MELVVADWWYLSESVLTDPSSVSLLSRETGSILVQGLGNINIEIGQWFISIYPLLTGSPRRWA